MVTKAGSLALEGWWSWRVDTDDPVPYGKEIVHPVSVCEGLGILFSGVSPPCVYVCAGVRWSVKGVGGEKGLQLGSGCQKKKPN